MSNILEGKLLNKGPLPGKSFKHKDFMRKIKYKNSFVICSETLENYWSSKIWKEVSTPE